MIPNGRIYCFPPASEGRATRNSREYYFRQLDEFEKTMNRLVHWKLNVYVDSVHRGNDEWFKNMFQGEHQFFDAEGKACVYKDDYCFLICFNVDYIPTPEEWVEITACMFGVGYKEEIVQRLIGCTIEETPIIKSESFQPAEVEKPFYDLNTHHMPDLDIMICEVRKPYTDRPYTLVIRNFSKKGMRPFFTGLFIKHSWGLCKGDIGFLKQVWAHYKMGGEFDLEEMMREDTEACVPRVVKDEEIGEYLELAATEPEVYRETLEHVIDLIKEKAGCEIVLIK